MGVHPQKVPAPNSQTTQDCLEQTEMIFQDVRKNATQAFIKYKAYYDKKSQYLETQRSGFRLRFAAESGSPRKQNSPYRFSVDWTLFY